MHVKFGALIPVQEVWLKQSDPPEPLRAKLDNGYEMLTYLARNMQAGKDPKAVDLFQRLTPDFDPAKGIMAIKRTQRGAEGYDVKEVYLLTGKELDYARTRLPQLLPQIDPASNYFSFGLPLSKHSMPFGANMGEIFEAEDKVIDELKDDTHTKFEGNTTLLASVEPIVDTFTDMVGWKA